MCTVKLLGIKVSNRVQRNLSWSYFSVGQYRPFAIIHYRSVLVFIHQMIMKCGTKSLNFSAFVELDGDESYNDTEG